MQDAEYLYQKACRFATALDACDYAAAAEFLAPDCRYRLSDDDVRTGPEEILASYRESDARARREFDNVKYSSEATADESGGIRLVFTDELHCGGSVHVFRCSQIVYFGADGKIHRIEPLEIPGERERLKDFCQSHGISPN